MKKLLQLFSHLIPFLLLGMLWVYFPVSVSPDPVFLFVFVLCLVTCPPVGLLCTSAFSRGLLGTLSILCFSTGIPFSLFLGGTLAGLIVLDVGCICLGTLLTAFLLPVSSGEVELLSLRGVRFGRARSVLLLRSCYAFFFRNSGILAGTIATWLLLIAGDASPNALWNSAGITATTALLGYLMYLILGAPAPTHRTVSPKKSRYVFISLLSFVLLMIAVYVYIGSIYTAPDPVLLAALTAVRSILTPALLAIAGGLVGGILLGYLLSCIGARFFAALCQGVLLFPAVLSAAFLRLFLPISSIAIAVPVVLTVALGILEGRLAIRPYRHFPIAQRGKSVFLPLFHFPVLALLPRIGMMAVFSGIFLDITSGGTLPGLDESGLLLVASILVVILSALYILCFLTKEVRRHG
ncbi:MAG: hypothetical protein E7408_00885 [Ruminococcaceae bacterium]|nr:hypothetical protein [Oscillospiraceae bacterium]